LDWGGEGGDGFVGEGESERARLGRANSLEGVLALKRGDAVLVYAYISYQAPQQVLSQQRSLHREPLIVSNSFPPVSFPARAGAPRSTRQGPPSAQPIPTTHQYGRHFRYKVERGVKVTGG